MSTTAADSTDTEMLRYLWTPDLDPLFWLAARCDVVSAWYGHVPFAHWIVAATKPRMLVELGTHNGVSYSAFCEAVVRSGLHTRCYAIDTWLGDDQAGHYGEEVYLDFRRFHDERYGAFSELLRCTFDEALPYIPDGSVDLLHMDGLHTYEAVKHDFESWRPKLSQSAVVLFHDTNVREREFGVWRLWEELQTQFPSFEFLHGHGLGVLAPGHSISPQVNALCTLRDAACINAIRQRFALLGERWTLFQQTQLLQEEVRAHATHISSLEAEIPRLEAEIARLKAEAAQRNAAEMQVRARAAQRSNEARAQMAKAVAEADRIARQTGMLRLADVAEAAPTGSIWETNKRQVVERLRQELVMFLAGENRLSFPNAERADVSVIVVLFNQAHFTLHCLLAVLSQSGVNVQVIVADNNSTDETSELLRRLDNVQVLRNPQNVGFLKAVNQAAVEARGRSILLLNSDAFLRQDALRIALKTLDSDPSIGAVGGRLILSSGRLQEAGGIVWSDANVLGYARGLSAESGEAMFRRDVDYCSGAFLLTPRDLFERLGGLDPLYAPAYFEDVDYCLRLWQAGLRVVYEPNAVIDHFEFGSQTRDGEAIELYLRNLKRLRLRHGAKLRLQHLPIASEGNVLVGREHSRTRRRLLVVDDEVPLRLLGRGSPRISLLLNEAAAAGWFVTLYPVLSAELDWKAVYAELSQNIEICNCRGATGLAAFLRDRQGYYDIILASGSRNMALLNDVTQSQPQLIAGARLVYDVGTRFAPCPTAKEEQEGRTIQAKEADALIDQELEFAAGVDSVVTSTISEAQAFRARQTPPVYVVGYSPRVTQEMPDFTLREGFLFIGELLEKDASNYHGLAWFVRSVWPRIHAVLRNVTLTVVGALHQEHSDLTAPGIRLLGPVDDARQLLAQARVIVLPARFAAGTAIQMLDAAAAGLPIVGTRPTAAVLGWHPGVELEATDDPTEMANAAIALYSNAARWQAVRTAALNRLVAEHSGAVFQAELRRLLDGAKPSVADAAEPVDVTDASRIAV
jgi:O-antigen biosynthesis protein